MARREDDPKDVWLVIHGHFYQPPRENPWLEAIEREVSAAPYPNWNARIADECYRANGWARVFDDQGRVNEIVNNYEHISFNFGPTLLSWLQTRAPRIYQRLLAADRRSVARRSGHGNALAQAYNHAILPLCNQRDRLTQLRWGLADFAHRFGRPAEAMWLPEAAVDSATVADLIDEGMRFIILAPGQAQAVRPLAAAGQQPADWTDVSPDRIDPRMPYRCFHPDDRTRHIDVFFYDGPVSHGLSFGRVLDSSEQLVDKLWGAVDAGRGGPQLVHTAVDGETFGHHMRYAERALSYALRHAAPRRGFRLTNYGEYLEQHPPTHEVQLAPGPDGEGTAWSCAHGVGRWCRDCGCNAGSPEGWTQAWRAPLRQAVNLVRDAAAELYEELGGPLLEDVWRARDAYVELLLDESPAARERFFHAHGRERGSSMAGQLTVLRLLEMQRHSLLAQTSCGWFFDDISGLEAVQVLKYAARTVQLYEDLSGRDLERPLLELLAQARSNLEQHGSGADVYRKLVLSASVEPHRLVAQYAITDRFRDYPDEHRFYGFTVHRVERRKVIEGSVSLSVGRLRVELPRLGEGRDVCYALIHFGGHDFHCAVRPFNGTQQLRQLTEQLERIASRATITELLRLVDANFGATYYGLQHLLAEERADVLQALFGHITDRFAEMYRRLYSDNYRAVNDLIETGLEPPREFRLAAEYVLSCQLNQEIEAQLRSRDPERYQAAQRVVREASRRGYQLDKRASTRIFEEMLAETVELLAQQPSPAACERVVTLADLAASLQFELDLEPAQDLLFELLQQREADAPWRTCTDELQQVLGRLRLAPSLLDQAQRS